MKILHVMAGAKYGGAETFFLDSLVALHEADIAQAVITRNNNSRKIKTIQNLGIPLKLASFNKYWRFPTSKAIDDMVKTFNPDIIQYWMGRAGMFAVKTNAINVAWYGGYYNPTKFRYADIHVGVTQDIVNHIIKEGIPSRNVFVLNTYAEFDESEKVDRKLFDTPEDAPLLLSLSRLHWKKGLDVLLKSMVLIPDAYLWIAGSGPLEKNLKNLSKKLGIESRVRFLGWRDDRGSLLSSCDVCVFPSRYEPFGTVIVEAWGRGVPLVAAKSAGPNAFITNGINGLLVDVDDVYGLSQAIQRILSSSDLSKNLKKGGLLAYNSGFSKKVFLNNALNFYKTIQKKKSF